MNTVIENVRNMDQVEFGSALYLNWQITMIRVLKNHYIKRSMLIVEYRGLDLEHVKLKIGNKLGVSLHKLDGCSTSRTGFIH